MPSFRFDYVKDIKELAGFLEKRIEPNACHPFKFRISQDGDYLTVLMDGCIRKNGRKYRAALENLSDILAEYILKSYEKKILDKIIKNFCEGLSRADRDEIYRIACARLYTQGETSFGNIIDYRRKLVSSKIMEYLQTSNNITLEGFVTFRLGEYVKKLEIEVERAIRQFFIERQYQEYINLLTAFVRMQVPRIPELHVFVLKNGFYKVEGTNLFEIPDDVIEGFGIQKNNPIIEDDDFMIGFLLTCAPVRIIIHNSAFFRNKELLNTIRIVFSECILLNE